jgi:peptide deformylase
LSVRVEAFDENGERVVLEANGWLSRILQHEIDHLNGIMYTDRMDPRTFMSKQLYERYWKDMPVETIRTGVIA